MTVFWITAGALLVASAIAMMIALRRGVPDADTAGADDLRVYRDQLAEIERDAARATLPTEEAARLRVTTLLAMTHDHRHRGQRTDCRHQEHPAPARPVGEPACE